MNVRYKNVISIFLVLAVTSNCGGGGATGTENSDNEQSPQVNSGVAVSDSPALSDEQASVPDDSDFVSTVDIVADRDFLFSSTSQLDINVDIYELKSERSYINICHETSQGTIDYKNCLLNAPLNSGQLNKQVALGHDISALHMEIWRYDLDSEPYTYRWSREAGLVWDVY